MKRLAALTVLGIVIAMVAGDVAVAAEGRGPGGRPTVGEIKKIDSKVLTIATKKEDGSAAEVTATVDDSTEIATETAVKLENVKVGDRVRITKEGKRVFGEVTKIDGKNLTVKSRNGEEQTVAVDDATTILANVKAKFEDLKVGQQVAVSVREGKAVRITIRATEKK